MAIPGEILRLARRYGPELDDVASKLRNPVNGRPLSGTALILKTVGVETGGSFRHKRPDGSLLKSPAGALGLGQFMPETRQEMIEKFKVDPWKDPESAIRGLVLHQQGKLGHAEGPRGYNPGDADNYERQVLGFKVGNVATGGSTSGGESMTMPGETQTVQLPGAPQLDLAGLLERTTPAPRPQAMGVAPPKFAAGQQFQSMPAAPAPPSTGPSVDLAGILASAQPPPGTMEMPAPSVTQSGRLQGGPPTRAGSGPDAVRSMFEAAEKIDQAQVPYKWGGGHSRRQSRTAKVTPLDCSGAVSRVLGIDPRVSGDFAGWGRAGRGKNVTIYANSEHVLMEINGRFFGTSKSNPGGGAGWIPRTAVSKQYLSRFTARHPPGM